MTYFAFNIIVIIIVINCFICMTTSFYSIAKEGMEQDPKIT